MEGPDDARKDGLSSIVYALLRGSIDRYMFTDFGLVRLRGLLDFWNESKPYLSKHSMIRIQALSIAEYLGRCYCTKKTEIIFSCRGIFIFL